MKTSKTQSFRHTSLEVKKVNKSSVTIVRTSVKTMKPPVQDPAGKGSFGSLSLQEATYASPKRK